MADLFQGSLLPSTTTTTETQSTAPEFYTNYLQDIANLGQNAVNQGGVAGFSPLQQQAFQMAPTTAFSGAGTATDAATLLRTSGSTAAPDIINAYMNPYTRNVVDEMARLQQQNLQRNVLPSIGASGVGTGGFGSKRQSQALGQSLADMQANLTGQQYGALNTGYQNAMTAAQADLSRMMNAGQGLTNTATAQYNIGSGGLKTLADMGATQQAQGQKILDYPMQQAKAFADLMHGYTIPTGSVTQTVQPGSSGQFSNSPLSQISGLLAAIGSFMNANNNSGTTGTSNSSLITDLINALKTPSTTAKDGGSITKYADGGSVAGMPPQGLDPSAYVNAGNDVGAYTQGFDPTTGMYTFNGLGGSYTMTPEEYNTVLQQQSQQQATQQNPIVELPYDPNIGFYNPSEVTPTSVDNTTTPIAMPSETPTDAVDVDQVVNDILMPNNVGSTTDVPVRNTDTPLPYERTTTTPRPQFGRGTKAGRVPAHILPVDKIKVEHVKLPKPVDQKFQEIEKQKIEKQKIKHMNKPHGGLGFNVNQNFQHQGPFSRMNRTQG